MTHFLISVSYLMSDTKTTIFKKKNLIMVISMRRPDSYLQEGSQPQQFSFAGILMVR